MFRLTLTLNPTLHKMWRYYKRGLDETSETYSCCWKEIPGGWAQVRPSPVPWTGYVASILEQSCCPFWGWSILKVYLGCSSSTRTQLNHQLQRCALNHSPGATPMPKLALGRERKGKWALEGELEEKLVFTITTVRAAVVRLIHPGLLR